MKIGREEQKLWTFEAESRGSQFIKKAGAKLFVCNLGYRRKAAQPKKFSDIVRMLYADM